MGHGQGRVGPVRPRRVRRPRARVLGPLHVARARVGRGRSGIVVDVYRVLASICEPYIGLYRRILPVAAIGGAGVDFSPFVALLVLQVIASLVAAAL